MSAMTNHEAPKGRTMKVSDLMTRDVAYCSIGASAEDAARGMWEQNVGSLPVIDVDGRVAGVVTDRDLCMAAWTRGQPLRDIPVTVPMSKDLHWCHPEDELEVAERAMADHHVRRLPVVDHDGAPLG